MKTLKSIIILLALVSLYRCDYVKKPKEISPTTTNGNNNVITRNILLEDYTGHTCGNCPQAAVKLNEIHNLYGKKVIAIAVHAGFFAEPTAAGTYSIDYRTPAGDAWDGFFGNSAAGNPNGMINRKDYTTSTHIKNHNAWASEISNLINQAADAKIILTPNYNTATKQLNLEVKTKFLKTLSNNYKLSVVLSEDSIISPQKDYSQNPSTLYNYTHRHVLRGAINGNFGEVLNASAVAANDSITKVFSNYAINSAFNENKLYVIAFIYDAASYEIIQAEEIKIK